MIEVSKWLRKTKKISTNQLGESVISFRISICGTEADGIVEYVDSDVIRVRRDSDSVLDEYNLLKFKRSNQGTCINQKPIVFKGEHVEKDEVIADGPSTENGEVALGKNLLIGFMTWEGYNYEDAIVLNERLIMDDILTSLHIEKYEIEGAEIGRASCRERV